MKNRITFVLTFLFLFLAVPVAAAAAEANSGTLAADKNNVAVSLHLPAGKTEGITSLRLQLRVSVVSGSMGKPVFLFDNAVKSTVKDAHISKEKDGGYLVDIIISGKKEQKLFTDSGNVKLGTLSVAPTSQDYQIRVEFAGKADGTGKPTVTYVDSAGLNSVTAPLSKADPVIVKPAGGLPSQSPSDQGTQSFGKKLKLTVSVKNGSNRVTFKWTREEGADGYVLFKYNTSKKKYVRVKTFANPKTVSYSKKYKYAGKYSFKLRAYKVTAAGTKAYGSFSSAAKVKLPPAKVKGVAKSQSYLKTTLSWKKVSKAKGYEIYRSQKKNGKFSRVKIVRTGKTNRVTIKQKKSRVYYYKIRAFVKGINKKRVYGNFSVVK